ncbi:MAG: HlyD family efflux transporter periplasmic adaptor subunit, partial [Flavobacteriales bacterium]|nr:HlyD family efflux transporter periplasmic adaptor subunit [Flavobacteriales bacterium]
MKSNNSLISTMFISLMLACNTAVEPITAENDAAIDIESLLESNQKIRIGPVITKSMNRIIECSGRIDVPPSEFISVHSRIKGVIDKVNYLPGDKVSRGDGLFVINDPELVERQRILAETHAKFEQVEKEYDRQKLLYESGATSLKKFENISAERKLLRARFDGLSAELQLIGVDTKPLLEEGSFSTYVIIRSPSNGYVHDVKVNKGQMISPEDVLLEMANDEHIHLELQVLSKDVTSVGLDQKVSFRIPQDTSTY